MVTSPTPLSPSETDVIDILSEIIYRVIVSQPTPEARRAKKEQILAACRQRLENKSIPVDAAFALTIGSAIAYDVAAKGLRPTA